MEGSVAELLDTEWWRASDDELLCKLQELEIQARQLYATQLKVLAEAEHRGLGAKRGYRDMVPLQMDLLRINRHESTRRVAHALALQPGRTLSGAVLEPKLPVLAQAAAHGALGADHIEAIVHTDQNMPMWATEADRTEAEKILVEAAHALPAKTIKDLGNEILIRLDQDGNPPRETELAEPVNELHLATKRDGRVSFKGELEPETGELLKVVLSPLAKPRATDGQPDFRSTGERQGDAFADLLRRAADAGDLPDDGGAKPHVVVTVSADQLRTGLGSAVLGDNGHLTASQARKLACDANVIPVVLGSKSEVLDIGRATRTIPTAIRRALVLRDRGCAFPGCDRPASWCDGHHIRHWSDGGDTKLDNLVLLCRSHHTKMHHTQWIVRIRDGIPEFIPPKFIDHEQRPRVNLLRRCRRSSSRGAVVGSRVSIK